MSFAAALFAPLVLLFPVSGLIQPEREAEAPPEVQEAGASPPDEASLAQTSDRADSPAWPFELVAESFRTASANQVRIEQRMTIRVTPLPAPAQPNMLMDLPGREVGPRFIERKIGGCIPISGISGVQIDGSNRLILYLRDRRMVRAELERSCRARDFYSGFYLARTADGQLCVDRDTLLSRNGANCKLTRIRRLIEVDP